MKYVPLEKFLGRPLRLRTGNYFEEKELKEAIRKFVAQFEHLTLKTNADGK